MGLMFEEETYAIRGAVYEVYPTGVDMRRFRVFCVFRG